MSTLFIDDVRFDAPYVSDDRAVAWAAEEKQRRRAADAAMDAILADVRRSGRRTAGTAVRLRAEAFIRRPETIDVLPGLDAASTPAAIIAVASMHLDHLRAGAPRRFGMGGEVSAINCRGAILYARWLRRTYRAAARAVAA